jgi:hypothetical protein
MADNYLFKDANKNSIFRAAKEIAANIFANFDIEIFENGTSVKSAANAIVNVYDANADGTLIIPANPLRKGLIIQGRWDEQLIYIKYGGSAKNDSASIIVPPITPWFMPYPIYRGVVGIGTNPGYTVSIFVTELT